MLFLEENKILLGLKLFLQAHFQIQSKHSLNLNKVQKEIK